MHRAILKVVLVAVTGLLLAAGCAAAQNVEQQRRKTCNGEATQKGLTGADRKAFMKTCLSAGGEAAAGKPVERGDDSEMQAAQRDLESARAHLQAAPHDYRGHRHQALENVDRALTSIKRGLQADERTERRE